MFMYFLLLIVLLFGSIDKIKSECSEDLEDQMIKCETSINEYLKSIGAGEGDNSPKQMIPTLNTTELLQLCELVKDFDKCVGTDNKANCSENISVRIVDSNYRYICESGKDSYEKHANCMHNIQTNSEFISCLNGLNAAQMDVKNQFSSKSKSDSETDEQDLMLVATCRNMNNFADCARKPIVELCGEDAWSIVRKTFQDTMPILVPNCNPKSDSLTSTIAAGKKHKPAKAELGYSANSQLNQISLSLICIALIFSIVMHN